MIYTWSYVMEVAKQCGRLRNAGECDEADILEKMLIDELQKCESINLNCTFGDL